jgi:thiamine biosynthesis lipoprotein ApbE
MRSLIPLAGRLARFLLKSQLLTVFLGLCVLGFGVGLATRPSPGVVPYGELFENMRVVSYRESPSDTSARFVVELWAGGKAFRQYDIDARGFVPPSRDRGYSRAITGTHYGPVRARGHVAQGLWLEVPDAAVPSLLREQFDELYRTTLGFVKPVSALTNVLGILSGYSVGYRLGAWSGSLQSRKVQQRVLATPDLGPVIAREAWRRVLLEPVLMRDEEDPARFATIHRTHQLYSNFFRIALNDSDGFIPREAARLAALGHVRESRAMLAFADAARRAANDSVHLASGDFDAIERWAGLLDRRGHWAHGAIPPPGEERMQYLGTLAWYGLAPSTREVDRVWVGPRLLVREGDADGFVADEILATRVGCPIGWRARLLEENTRASAMASVWLADRPEFVALGVVGGRVARGLARTGARLAAWRPESREPTRRIARDTSAAPPAATGRAAAATPALGDSTPRRPIDHRFPAMGLTASIIVIGADSASTAPPARAAKAAIDRLDSLMRHRATIDVADRDTPPGALPAHPEVAVAVGAALDVLREGDESFDATVGPLIRAWGIRGGFAKGYAADAAADTLRALGARDALVAIAGSMVALGHPTEGNEWSVGVRDPRDRVSTIARLRLAPGQALATAGKHEPFAGAGSTTVVQSLDPRTGGRAEGPLAVTVVASRAMEADAWSAALFVLGPAEARRRASERPRISVVLIEPGGDGIDTIWVESDLRERFELDPDARVRFRVEYF